MVGDTLMAAAEAGEISWEKIARAAMAYMNHDDLQDMAECEGLLPDEDDL